MTAMMIQSSIGQWVFGVLQRTGMEASLRRQILVRTVAHRLFRRALAGAEPRLLARGRFVFHGSKASALVRSVAKRLRLRAPAGAPPITFFRFDLDRDWPPTADFGHRAHVCLPPPSVANQAAPQALASSRTRKI